MKHAINGAGGVLVITLHQPGSEVSALVDDLLLLGYGGSPVFMGPWGAALPYFTGHLGLHLPQHTGLADWLLALLDKEAHAVQQQQQCLQLKHQKHNHSCDSSKAGSSCGSSSTFTSAFLSSFGSGSIAAADSRSSSISMSGGGGGGGGGGGQCVPGCGHAAGHPHHHAPGCGKSSSIILHAHSGSTSSSSGSEGGPLSSMAAAWKKYQASGKAAVAAAPYVSADSATLLSAGLNPHEVAAALNPSLPGLAEITEASSDDDADIIITTIVVDAQHDQQAAESLGTHMMVLPTSAAAHHTPCPTPRTASGSKKAATGVVGGSGGAAAAGVAVRGPSRGVVSASLPMQVRVLAGRAFRWWLRNPAMLLSGEDAAVSVETGGGGR